MNRRRALLAALAAAVGAALSGCATERPPLIGAAHTTGATLPMDEKRALRATGRTDVDRYEPVVFDEVAGGPTLADVRLTERFAGDIEGEGVVHGVQAARADGTSTFCGLERVRGRIHGKYGTFLLEVRRRVIGKEAHGAWSVVPGSGTGELRGLRGSGGFRAELGEHGAVWLDYDLAAPR